MAWQGYFEYDGNEIINASRTESYIRSAGLTWFRPVFENDALPYMLGHGLRYVTPLKDNAPWVDPTRIESLDFYGIYPLDVTGIEDSTRTAQVIESIGEGGVVGRGRNGSKTVVFNTVLLAGTEAAADYGITWLKQVLNGGVCGGAQGCGTAELCYLSSVPDMEVPGPSGVMAQLDGGYFFMDSSGEVQVDQPEIDGGTITALPNEQFDGGTPWATGDITSDHEFPFDFVPTDDEMVNPLSCLNPYLRTFQKVSVTTAPSVTGKRQTSDGCAVWTVQFTLTAGSPYVLGAEVPVVEGFLDPAITMPWAGGILPDGASIDLDGYIHTEAACAVSVYDPIFDPLFPALIPPPGVPNVPLGNYKPPVNWRRRQFTIPQEYIPLWGEVVPKMQVHARKADVRNLRLRFYSDPYKVGDISDDPCAFCGDIVVSYVPKEHTLVFDGAEQAVYVLAPGGARRRADSLVFGTDGTPFEWPVLSCGFGYIVTIDLPQTQVPPVVDLSLYSRMV